MATQRTDRAVPPEAELLKEMHQGQCRLTEVDSDIATLFRLSDDPLQLNAFLHRKPDDTDVPRSHREAAAAGLAYQLQCVAVPFREGDSTTPARRYVLSESKVGTSLQPFAFNPDELDCDLALQFEGASSPGEALIAEVFQRLWPGLLPFVLAGTIFGVTLFLVSG